MSRTWSVTIHKMGWSGITSKVRDIRVRGDEQAGMVFRLLLSPQNL